MRLSRAFVRTLEKFAGDERNPSRERVAVAELLVKLHLADERMPPKQEEQSPALRRLMESMDK